MPAAYYSDGGRYKCTVNGQAMSESSEKGTPCFVLSFVVNTYIDANGNEEDLDSVEQKERSIYLYITDKTIDFLLDDLEHLGFTGRSFSQLDPEKKDHQSFIGDVIQCRCKHEEYEGEQKERWSLDRGRVIAPLDGGKLQKLDTMFGQELANRFGAAAPKKKAPKKKPAKQQVEETSPPADDDIPF